ncbi:flagellar associated protein [Reticulomyxa filosa]|uniref:Cilia- and flagella-associated protein 157 n=1 Tax=Reticulomyxa filosa TaxID=46433 RepID=X6LSQ4_RETFI|nr:flagellar associated protein [Reticulomyxa filosa]|eukprot:ETO04376.1 flagellar associated protein [Reticulomyxa filosa]
MTSSKKENSDTDNEQAKDVSQNLLTETNDQISKKEDFDITIANLKSELESKIDECEKLKTIFQETKDHYENQIDEKNNIIFFLEKSMENNKKTQIKLEEKKSKQQIFYKFRTFIYLFIYFFLLSMPIRIKLFLSIKIVSYILTTFFLHRQPSQHLQTPRIITSEIERRELIQKLREFEKDLTEAVNFKNQKEDIQKELAETKQALQKQKCEQETKEAELERKFLLEKQNMKKDLLNKIRESKSKLLELTKNQLSFTTKRIIIENEQMAVELQYQSKETEKLIRQLTQKQQENTKLKQEIQIYLKNEEMLEKKIFFLNKSVNALRNEMIDQKKNNNSEILLCHKDNTHCKNNVRKPGNINKSVYFQSEMAKAETKGYQRAQHEIKELKTTIVQLQKQTPQNDMLYKQFLEMQQDSVTFIWCLLQDVKKQLQIKENDLLSTLSLEKRKDILERLFEFELLHFHPMFDSTFLFFFFTSCTITNLIISTKMQANKPPAPFSKLKKKKPTCFKNLSKKMNLKMPDFKNLHLNCMTLKI